MISKLFVLLILSLVYFLRNSVAVLTLLVILCKAIKHYLSQLASSV